MLAIPPASPIAFSFEGAGNRFAGATQLPSAVTNQLYDFHRLPSTIKFRQPDTGVNVDKGAVNIHVQADEKSAITLAFSDAKGEMLATHRIADKYFYARAGLFQMLANGLESLRIQDAGYFDIERMRNAVQDDGAERLRETLGRQGVELNFYAARDLFTAAAMALKDETAKPKPRGASFLPAVQSPRASASLQAHL